MARHSKKATEAGKKKARLEVRQEDFMQMRDNPGQGLKLHKPGSQNRKK